MNMNHQNGETQAYFNLKHTSAKLIKCKREIVHISLTTFSDSNCSKLLTSIKNIKFIKATISEMNYGNIIHQVSPSFLIREPKIVRS